MSKATILYVEDNIDNRTLVKRVLMSEDYVMAEASNATEALETIDKQRPDLILMDISMPEVDGYALTTKIKNMPGLQTVPILALTANVMKGDRERILGAGCDGYIQKPIDVDQLPQQVRSFLKEVSRG